MKARGLFAIVMSAALTGSGCSGEDGGRADGRAKTLVIAQLTGPLPGLDPALNGSVVTYVVVRPVLETLVTIGAGGSEIVPLLATSWQVSEEGRSWTFRLREGVRFHDGTLFDAEAVCANFERWYRFRGLLQHLAGEWTRFFGGFATQDNPSIPNESLYRSCEARADQEVVLNLTRANGAFLPALAVPGFAMASPTALRRHDADKVSGSASEPVFEGSYGTSELPGTGSFRLERWDRNDKAVLVRNPSYWGPRPELDRVIIRQIDDGGARRQALQAGEVDAIFPLDAADIEPLRSAGFQVYEQPGFSLGFVGLNRARPPLDNAKIRQAVAHALDREKVVRAKYPASAAVAREVVPPNLWGHAPDVRVYPYDPDRARQLISESGVSRPILELWYPTGLPQGPPALPDPEGIALSFKADLEKAGFTVVPKPTPWFPDWSQAMESATVQVFLGDIYGFRVDPDVLFDQLLAYSALGRLDDNLLALLRRGEAEADQRQRAPLYEQANRMVMEDAPVVPLVHVKPAIAYSRRVTGYTPSPIPWEGLFSVRLR